jgi:hypothetical protein
MPTELTNVFVCTSPGQVWAYAYNNLLFGVVLNDVAAGVTHTIVTGVDYSSTFAAVTIDDTNDSTGDIVHYIFPQVYTTSKQPLPYPYVVQDPFWFLGNTFQPDWTIGTFSMFQDWFENYVALTRNHLIESMTTGTTVNTSVETQDQAANGYYTFNAINTIVDGWTMYTDNFGIIVTNPKLLYPTADGVFQDYNNCVQGALQGQMSGIFSPSSSSVSSIVSAINSLQTNVSINHGQAIFSVQGGAITGP